MSFELYLECLEGNPGSGISRAALRSLFPVTETDSEADFWTVSYGPSNQCDIALTAVATDPSFVESLCILRPCADARLWDALLAVLRLGPSVLFFPGEAPPLVASDASAALVPADMVEALGAPRVVRSGREIADIVRSA